jgi:Dolichyl-phosphate-mannose-protein mannosyltransferase
MQEKSQVEKLSGTNLVHPSGLNVPSVLKTVNSKVREPWLLVVIACFFSLAWASWGKLGDIVLDLGHEVEIPARLLNGELLYRDIQCNYGPLSYYVNAAALYVFGCQVEVFFAIGLVLAFISTLATYFLAKRLTDGYWATLCALSLQLYCVFSPGLNNFVFTYSFGSVYAIALSFVALTCFARYQDLPQKRWLMGAGLMGALACLSKQEYGVALIGSLLVGFSFCPAANTREKLQRCVQLLCFSCVPVFLVLGILASQMPWQTLTASLFPIQKLGSFANSSLAQISPAKTLDIWFSSFKAFLLNSLVVICAMLLTRVIRLLVVSLTGKRNENFWDDIVEIVFAASLSAVGLIVRQQLNHAPQQIALHPLAYLHWLLPALLGWGLIRGKKLPLLCWVLIVHALIVNVRWLFYIGFYELYVFSALLSFFVMLYWTGQKTSIPISRYISVCLIASFGIRFQQFSQYQYPIRSPHGTLYIRDATIASAYNRTIETVLALHPSSLLVLPEGALLNFLTNTRSPDIEMTFLPSALPTSSDEIAFLERMHRHPPAMVVEIFRRFPEWKYESYAQFNPIVYHWVIDEHRLIQNLSTSYGDIRIFSPLKSL